MPVDLFTLIQTPLSGCVCSAPAYTYSALNDVPLIRRRLKYQKTSKPHFGETENALELRSKQFELGGSGYYIYVGKRASIVGDVAKYAHDEIVAPMEVAFCSLGPAVWQVSSMVPLPPLKDANSTARRTEFVFADQDGTAYAILMILSPRSIKPYEWTGEDRGGPSSIGPRIRKHAHQMRCPQVLVFDGTTLLRLGFDDIDHIETTDSINVEFVCEDPDALWGEWRPPVQDPADCTVRELVYATILKGLRRRTIEKFSLQRTCYDLLSIHSYPGDGSLWYYGGRDGPENYTDQMALRKVEGTVALSQGLDDYRPFRMEWVLLAHGTEMPLVFPF